MSRIVCRLVVVLFGVLAAGFGTGIAKAIPASLSADQIMRNAVARAVGLSARDSRPDYRYTKHTITEEIDSKGRLKEHKEKRYDVLVESGLSYLKLLEINGQSLSASELRKQEAKETAERQKLTDARPGQKGDERENFLTADLVDRYKFTLDGEKTVNGRKFYVLKFEPKKDLPVHKLTDRFLNQVSGTVWMDAQEFEIGRAEVHLNAEVALWGGLIGTLRQCSYTLERTRLPDGSWFNSVSHGIFEGRKLLEPMLIRTRSQSSGFHRVDLAAK